MEGIIVSIIVIAIATMIVTQPYASTTIQKLLQYLAGAIRSTLGTN